MSTTSEPELVQSQANEDYPVSTVPLEARKSFWSLAPLLMGFTLYSGTLRLELSLLTALLRR